MNISAEDLSGGFFTPQPFRTAIARDDMTFGMVGRSYQRTAFHIIKPEAITDLAELGEFVYHCHILEHEDGGMMAKIQVVPAPY